MLTAGAALAVLAVLAASTALRGDRFAAPLAALGGVGMLALLVALAARLPTLVPVAVALAGAQYGVMLLVRDGATDALSPAYSAGLLLLAELAYWSLEPDVPGERGLAARRAGLVAAATLASAGIGAVVLSVAELAAEGGVLLEAAGVAAATAVLVLVVLLARRIAALGPGT